MLMDDMLSVKNITTSSREISLVCLELFIFPYHEINILTWRRGGEGGEVLSESVPLIV